MTNLTTNDGKEASANAVEKDTTQAQQQNVTSGESPIKPSENGPVTTLSKEDVEKLVVDNIKSKLEENVPEAVKEEVDKQIKKEIAVDKASLFTVFGIFASIVTFVSVEIQILKTICDFWNIAGFSLIILASLLIFILLLDYIGRGWRDDPKVKFPWEVSLFVIGFLIAGFLSASFGNEEQCKDNSIYQRYENNFTEKQDNIEKMFDEKFQELRNAVKDNSEQIQSLKNPHDSNSQIRLKAN